MARDSKLEVAAINIRIPEDRERDYVALLKVLAGLKRGMKVYGDTAVAIQSFDAKTRTGLFSKFTEIDVSGDWFDVEEFAQAKPEDKESIQIPDKLRPNYSAFYFRIDPELHVVAFEIYSLSKSLSPRAVRRYFQQACMHPSVTRRFGNVQADIVNSFKDADRLLRLPNIKEVEFIIRRPNSDDIGEDLAAAIEEQLTSQNADEYHELIKSSGHGGGIKPNARSLRLGTVAAENGEMRVINLTNGVPTIHGTEPVPLCEGTKYKQDDDSVWDVFLKLSTKIFETIKSAREANVKKSN